MTECNQIREQFPAWILGELSGPQAERLQEHLRGCPNCQREREEVTRTIQAVRDSAESFRRVPYPGSLREELQAKWAKPASATRRRVLWAAAAAAALILAVLGMLLYQSFPGEGRREDARAGLRVKRPAQLGYGLAYAGISTSPSEVISGAKRFGVSSPSLLGVALKKPEGPPTLSAAVLWARLARIRSQFGNVSVRFSRKINNG